MNEFICEFSLGDGDGLTIAIDDTIDVAAYPTSLGSPALAASAPARHHADVVAHLLTAGWHVVGKTNTQELAFGESGVHPSTGTPENPQDAQLIPGGASSGGAAAVGLYLCDAALGSDSDGAVRLPAACCGVVGMKPTFGRIARVGASLPSSTLACMAPSAREVLTVIDVMAAITPQFNDMLAYSTPNAMRIGVMQVDADAAIVSAVRAAPSPLGWQTSACDLPHFAAAAKAAAAIRNSELWTAFGHLLIAGQLSKSVDTQLRWAAETSPHDLAMARAVRDSFSAELDAAFEHVDAIILPSLPTLPVTLAHAAMTGVFSWTTQASSFAAMRGSFASFLTPFNLSGHPSITLPLPLHRSHDEGDHDSADDGLMAGLQIVGRKGEDELLCALASQFEASMR